MLHYTKFPWQHHCFKSPLSLSWYFTSSWWLQKNFKVLSGFFQMGKKQTEHLLPSPQSSLRPSHQKTFCFLCLLFPLLHALSVAAIPKPLPKTMDEIQTVFLHKRHLCHPEKQKSRSFVRVPTRVPYPNTPKPWSARPKGRSLNPVISL